MTPSVKRLWGSKIKYFQGSIFNWRKGSTHMGFSKGGLFLLDCFNPNIQYIVENEKGQAAIAKYTTDDGRKVLIKQTMRYESATQINRIEWHYFINGEFHSTQNLDMRLFFPQELDSYLKQAGFDIVHKFGYFEEKPFDDKSEKQIYVLSLSNKKQRKHFAAT